MGASAPDFPKQLNILGVEGPPGGDDQVEWLGRRASKGLLIVSSVLNAPCFGGQNTCKYFIDFAPGRYHQRNLLRCGRNRTVTGTFHLRLLLLRPATTFGVMFGGRDLVFF
jgi:hypothetical protein